MTRSIMTAAELNAAKTGEHGRDYRYSDDGYDDMAVAEKRGWRVLAGWGRDGWELGDWPYVAIYVKPAANRFDPGVPTTFGLMQITEGDHTMYEFTSAEDRQAAIDYLFLWYAAGESWAPLTYEDRGRLNRGELTVDAKFRGPYNAGGPLVPVSAS